MSILHSVCHVLYVPWPRCSTRLGMSAVEGFESTLILESCRAASKSFGINPYRYGYAYAWRILDRNRMANFNIQFQGGGVDCARMSGMDRWHCMIGSFECNEQMTASTCAIARNPKNLYHILHLLVSIYCRCTSCSRGYLVGS